MKKKGGKEMGAAPVKPIRPTTIEFKDDVEMQRFVNYATSKKKTKNEHLNRVREGRKKHRRAEEMK
jgi:hypothetical protein